jgi:hypothetical protein
LRTGDTRAGVLKAAQPRADGMWCHSRDCATRAKEGPSYEMSQMPVPPTCRNRIVHSRRAGCPEVLLDVRCALVGSRRSDAAIAQSPRSRCHDATLTLTPTFTRHGPARKRARRTEDGPAGGRLAIVSASSVDHHWGNRTQARLCIPGVLASPTGPQSGCATTHLSVGPDSAVANSRSSAHAPETGPLLRSGTRSGCGPEWCGSRPRARPALKPHDPAGNVTRNRPLVAEDDRIAGSAAQECAWPWTGSTGSVTTTV